MEPEESEIWNPALPVCPACGYNGRMYFHGGSIECPNCKHREPYNLNEYLNPCWEGMEVVRRSV